MTTDLDTLARRAGLTASDPDGGWYVREGDHRDREDNKGKTLRKIAWALEATIATMARPPGTAPSCPNLATGLALARPGEDPGGTGARVLASVAARGHKTGWLGYDRAYTAALPHRFHLPARAHCQEFFPWYNNQHRHGGLGLHTAADVHHGRATAVRAARAGVLAAAYQQHPERFVCKPPAPPKLAGTSWINPPEDKEAATQ